MNEILTLLNAAEPARRLANLRRLDTTFPPMEDHINNHIHTTFSFSPYSPTAAAWRARAEGLCTAGIIDHDSLGGNREFLEACRVLGLGGTNGVECRVSMAGTPFESVRVNNPDQPGNAYILLHAVPHARIEEVDDFFAPRREKRNDRNRAMIAKLNALLAGSGVSLDFDRDVLPISQYANRGTVTERHLSSALALKLGHVFGSGERLVAFLRGLDKPVTARQEALLSDPENPHFHYDLIGWIKAELIPAFYIPATDECAPVADVIALADRVGAISAYSYLGDVGESVTGDKRAQKFEDDYLDALMDTVADIGFKAIAYMPTRNTPAQLERLRALIEKHNFMPICGEDINQPRQKFVCEAMRGGRFGELREATWAMIAHEREENGLFSAAAAKRWPDLAERVAAFAELGRTYTERERSEGARS